jgi:hypothetical protein
MVLPSDYHYPGIAGPVSIVRPVIKTGNKKQLRRLVLPSQRSECGSLLLQRSILMRKIGHEMSRESSDEDRNKKRRKQER